jgi:hypothetical protein
VVNQSQITSPLSSSTLILIGIIIAIIIAGSIVAFFVKKWSRFEKS